MLTNDAEHRRCIDRDTGPSLWQPVGLGGHRFDPNDGVATFSRTPSYPVMMASRPSPYDDPGMPLLIDTGSVETEGPLDVQAARLARTLFTLRPLCVDKY